MLIKYQFCLNIIIMRYSWIWWGKANSISNINYYIKIMFFVCEWWKYVPNGRILEWCRYDLVLTIMGNGVWSIRFLFQLVLWYLCFQTWELKCQIITKIRVNLNVIFFKCIFVPLLCSENLGYLSIACSQLISARGKLIMN